ncbi:rhodanese-like domain-containing protein [Nonlabens sp.]|uniref:rhodanese-like domain-containing protein n=1 Tax=Nonlabens sp. TaxID=1888209 RepID=UPI003266138D
MKKLLNFIIVLLLALAFHSCKEEKSGTINKVSIQQAEEIIAVEGVKVVDVRTKSEFTEKHIKNAVNIEVENDDLNSYLDTMDKTQPLLVYCNKGGQSARCAKILQDKGFTLIYDMKGGITKWEESGREVIVKN